MSSFEDLVREALARPFEGWDFSWIEHRNEIGPEPWDYRQLVIDASKDAASMLDLGTGGGEFIAELPVRPPLTVATEAWLPNVPIAGANLRRVGAYVVGVEIAADNVAQGPVVTDGRLPFRDGAFDVVIDRHEAFRASEVARVLAPGGTFLSQQIGSRNEIELNEATDAGPPEVTPTAGSYETQLTEAGLVDIEISEGFIEKRYLDVGAVAYFMKAIPWQVGGFDLSSDPDRLRPITSSSNATAPSSRRCIASCSMRGSPPNGAGSARGSPPAARGPRSPRCSA